MLAIIEAYQSGLFNAKYWPQNIVAGLIVGVVALPLAMAFAIASGLNPQQGLYTAIIAGFIVAIFGGSRVQIAGPTGAFVVILANITAQYGIAGLQIATLLAGLILIAMGILKLGNVIKFIPDPVIVGFTSGIGVIIFIGQWKDFFGLSINMPLNAHFHNKLWALIEAFPNFDVATTGLAFFTLILLWLSPKLFKLIPAPLIAMVAATSLQVIFQFKTVATIGTTFGKFSTSLPSFNFPTIPLSHALNLIGAAFTIALLGAIESLLSATAADAMSKTRHDSNQELIGQGIANVFTPLFGGFAATGAIARTATNIRHGGNSPLAAIIHSIFLVFVILVLAPLASDIPLCALAAILFVVAYGMSDIPHFIHMMKYAPNYDRIVLLVTFFLTIFTNLVVAVNIGVILAMLFFVRRMHQLISIEKQDVGAINDELVEKGLSLHKDTIVYAIQGPFFFGVAEKIEHAFAVIHSDPKIIIFRLGSVPFMDITGLQTFSEVIEQFHKRGVTIYLCEANKRVSQKIINIGIVQWISHGCIFDTFADVVKTIGSSATIAHKKK